MYLNVPLAALAFSLTSVGVNAGGFMATCSQFSLRGGNIFSAFCLNTNGITFSSSVDLNKCVGNQNGYLVVRQFSQVKTSKCRITDQVHSLRKGRLPPHVDCWDPSASLIETVAHSVLLATTFRLGVKMMNFCRRTATTTTGNMRLQHCSN